MSDWDEMYVVSVDVCAICSDPECDGVGCYAALDPEDEADQARIEQVQSWVRHGQAWDAAETRLAFAENREHLLPSPPRRTPRPPSERRP